MKTHPIQEALERAAATQAELANHLEVDPSTLSNKLTGRRRWTADDCSAVLAFFRARGQEVTFEQLFEGEPVEPERVSA